MVEWVRRVGENQMLVFQLRLQSCELRWQEDVRFGCACNPHAHVQSLKLYAVTNFAREVDYSDGDGRKLVSNEDGSVDF